MIIYPTASLVLELCVERAIWWAQHKTIFVADLHLGRSSPVTPQDAAPILHSLARISALVEQYSATRVVFLGDMFHMKRNYNEYVLRIVAEWRKNLHDVQIILVRGNHERVLGDPPPELHIDCVDPGYSEAGLTFLHEPRHSDHYSLCAHLHPNILVPSTRVAAEAVPCFVLGSSYLVLPAFDDLQPGRIIRKMPDEAYAYIQNGQVVMQ